MILELCFLILLISIHYKRFKGFKRFHRFKGKVFIGFNKKQFKTHKETQPHKRDGRVGKGISAQASHRTVREALTSYGSYHTIKRV